MQLLKNKNKLVRIIRSEDCSVTKVHVLYFLCYWVFSWLFNIHIQLLYNFGTSHNLLSFKESISDFYWYYSGKDVIDEPGKKNFSKAMAVAKQIFNSLTEYIQVTFEQIRHLPQQVVYYVSDTLFSP